MKRRDDFSLDDEGGAWAAVGRPSDKKDAKKPEREKSKITDKFRLNKKK